MTPRIVIIHGVCAGAGQSTLFEAIRDREAVPGADYLEEDSEDSVRYPGYPAHFDRVEFHEVAERFFRHNADRSAGIGHPTAAMLEEVWRRLVEKAIARDTSIVSGLSFIDGAEDLDWAMASESSLHDHSRAVARIMAPLDPVVIYLGGDIDVAIDRAIAQKRRNLFGFDASPESNWPAFRDALVSDARARAARILTAFEVGGWSLTPIDGTRQTAADVLDSALGVLRAAGIAPESEERVRR